MSEPTTPQEPQDPPAPPAPPRGGWRAVVGYTVLRLLLLLVVWLPLQLLTPMRGIIALLVALLLSGVLSFLLLDRQRDAMSVVVGRVFRRIDERIERSRTAEDDDDLEGSDGGTDGAPAAPSSPTAGPEAQEDRDARDAPAQDDRA